MEHPSANQIDLHSIAKIVGVDIDGGAVVSSHEICDMNEGDSFRMENQSTDLPDDSQRTPETVLKGNEQQTASHKTNFTKIVGVDIGGGAVETVNQETVHITQEGDTIVMKQPNSKLSDEELHTPEIQEFGAGESTVMNAEETENEPTQKYVSQLPSKPTPGDDSDNKADMHENQDEIQEDEMEVLSGLAVHSEFNSTVPTEDESVLSSAAECSTSSIGVHIEPLPSVPGDTDIDDPQECTDEFEDEEAVLVNSPDSWLHDFAAVPQGFEHGNFDGDSWLNDIPLPRDEFDDGNLSSDFEMDDVIVNVATVSAMGDISAITRRTREISPPELVEQSRSVESTSLVVNAPPDKKRDTLEYVLHICEESLQKSINDAESVASCGSSVHLEDVVTNTSSQLSLKEEASKEGTSDSALAPDHADDDAGFYACYATLEDNFVLSSPEYSPKTDVQTLDESKAVVSKIVKSTKVAIAEEWDFAGDESMIMSMLSLFILLIFIFSNYNIMDAVMRWLWICKMIIQLLFS